MSQIWTHGLHTYSNALCRRKVDSVKKRIYQKEKERRKLFFLLKILLIVSFLNAPYTLQISLLAISIALKDALLIVVNVLDDDQVSGIFPLCSITMK